MEDAKKRAALAAAAAAAAAGVVLGSAFSDPVDLLQSGPSPVAQSVETEDDTDPGDGQEGSLRGGEHFRARAGSGIRAAVLSLPDWVRAAVALPLWCLGWVLLRLLGWVLPALSPVVLLAGKWLLTGLALFAILAVSAKLACPGIPWRSLLRRRNLAAVLVLPALLTGLDAALPHLWEGYERAAPLFHLLGGGVTLAFPLAAILRRQRRQPAPTMAESETEEQRVRRVARELADSVCPPRAW